jgi:hypothetical protein
LAKVQSGQTRALPATWKSSVVWLPDVLGVSTPSGGPVGGAGFVGCMQFLGGPGVVRPVGLIHETGFAGRSAGGAGFIFNSSSVG